MALFQTFRPIPSGASFTARLNGVYAAMSTWNDTRATRKSLGKLSDLQLSDVGLNRGDIDQITR